MAIARKNTRRLVVDAEVFRWTISPDDEPGIALVAEHYTEPARRLVAWFEHGVSITPKVAAECIRGARACGWNPSERGPDFVIAHNWR